MTRTALSWFTAAVPVGRCDARAGAGVDLLDVAALNLECAEVSDRLLDEKVAATRCAAGGGEIADRHVRFVFSNEAVERIALLGTRVRAALAAAGQRT